jgi:predicted RNase H-like nuclease (RuvC/YqgF family)
MKECMESRFRGDSQREVIDKLREKIVALELIEEESKKAHASSQATFEKYDQSFREFQRQYQQLDSEVTKTKRLIREYEQNCKNQQSSN